MPCLRVVFFVTCDSCLRMSLYVNSTLKASITSTADDLHEMSDIFSKKKKKNVVCYKFSLALLRVRFVFLFMCYSCMRRSFHVNKLVDYAASSKICLPGIYIYAHAHS